jgi:hypothetical protein
MVSMDDNILVAVGCVIAVHHDTYLHQLLLLVTPFVAKEDTIMTTHTGCRIGLRDIGFYM